MNLDNALFFGGTSETALEISKSLKKTYNITSISRSTSSNKKNLAVGGTSSAVVALVMDDDNNEKNKEKVVETIWWEKEKILKLRKDVV